MEKEKEYSFLRLIYIATYQHVKAKQLYEGGNDTSPQLSWGDLLVLPTCVSVKAFSKCFNKGSESILKFKIKLLQFNNIMR